MLDSLYAYNDWANARIFELANGLTAEQLDTPRKMGFGTLRATLFHIWAAERLWLERWRNHPGPSYPGGEATCSLAEIADGLREVARSRRELIDAERAEGWSRTVIYRDLRNQEHRQRLGDLLLHVANHGIHHRAQALNFLKHLGRKTSGGIDYLFFRIAHPSTPLKAEFIEPLRQSGLEVATGEGTQDEFNQRLLQRYFRYQDWAIDQLMALIHQLAPESLHRSSDIGVGSIHKTIVHLRNAEEWWMGIWSGSANSFARYDPAESLQEIEARWQTIRRQRNSLLDSLDATSAARVTVANPGQLKIPVRVQESMLQLCGHGTHHRAQIINMLRHAGIVSPGLDFVFWARGTPD